MDNSHAERTNRDHWDEIASIHLRSYDIDGLLNGISGIDKIQKRELYPVEGKDLIHLQCHIGTDTLSLALDGAKVTGVDFSSKSIEIARQLAARMNLEADFIEANVLDLKGLISKKYDIVYTSKGVLCWIRDLDRWAETISYLLKEGGCFYILETHPMVLMFDDTLESDLQIKYPYFHQDEPTHFDDDHPDYADKTYVPRNKTYEWTWSLSEIVNALIRNGLKIELLKEYDELFYEAFPKMGKSSDNWFFLEKYKGMVPLTFTLLARK
jgi:SAM-dependent methyltransferase